MSAAPQMDSQVTILKTDASAKKGTGVKASQTEVVWPIPQFGASTVIDNVTDGGGANGFIVPAGSMFPLGAAIPRSTLMHGAYFPPGTMGVLVPIHARMVSVQPIQTKKPGAPPAEPVCCIQ